MRKVTYGGAVSLDLYLAGPGEAMDWLRWSDDAAKLSAESFEGADTMLMGRKTFDYGMRNGYGLGPVSGLRTIIFSSTLNEVPEGAELVREDAAAFVRELKTQPGGDIIVMGGGELGSALIEAELVDEIGFTVHPLILGGGIPALRPMARRVELELIEARPIAEGCVLMRYRLGRSPASNQGSMAGAAKRSGDGRG
jgi:dihydrofolate reductase